MMCNLDLTGFPVGTDHQNLFKCFQVLRELPQILNQFYMIGIAQQGQGASPMRYENELSHLLSQGDGWSL